MPVAFFCCCCSFQTDTVDLQWKRENVCVASSDDIGLFAVGSQAYVTLIDHRCASRGRDQWLQIPSRNGERGQIFLFF